MNFKFPKKEYNAEDLIKRCGYGEIYDRKTEQVSYKRALGSGGYPRFHVYLKDFEDYFEVSLHLDQKKASYIGTSAHSGEYEGEQVENEARRITAEIASIYGMQI
jgi:hypothetical protein